MEDEKNPELQSWMKTQVAYVHAYLDRQPSYIALLSRARELATGDLQIHQVDRVKDHLVCAKVRPGENLTKLYVRDGVSTPERLLYDPAKESTDQEHVSLGNFQLSDDGRYTSYIAMRSGGELSFIYRTQPAQVVHPISGQNHLPDVPQFKANANN